MNTPAAYWSDLLALLYPEFCAGCAASLVKGEVAVCTYCRAVLPQTMAHLDEKNTVARRFWGRIPLQHALAFLHFRKRGRVQKMMHAFKYEGRREVGVEMGRWYGGLLHQAMPGAFDVVLPVPLHPRRLRVRGYNQSEVFGSALAEALHLPLFTEVLVRVEHRGSQTRRGRIERWQNARQTFAVHWPETIRGKRVLLVDDIITTGATLEACGEILLEQAQPASLSVVAIAAAE